MDNECKNIIEVAEGPSVCAPEEPAKQNESSGLDISAYYFKTTVDKNFDDTIAKVKELAASEGFGIISEIDVQVTIKKKLGMDFPKYMILGLCNPGYAHKALEIDMNIGLLLPCNIVVYEHEEKVVVAALDPIAQLSIVGESGFQEFAASIKEKLVNMLKQL